MKKKNGVEMMKKYPFVSVAVVAYNAEKYIEECLDSLVNLDYPKNKYEILLFDGSSTDRTVELAEKFKKVKIIKNPKRIISAGRNLAIKHSKGKYLAFTDSDCKADKNWLKVLVEKIESSPDDVIAYGGPNLVFDTDPPIARVIGYMQETYIGSGGSPGAYRIKEGINVISLGNANVIYKKDIIKNYIYDECVNIGEDCQFNFNFKQKGFKMIYTNDAIVWHHRRDSIKGLMKNMFNYGEAQPKIARIYGKLTRYYSVIPSLFILFLIITPILALFNKFFLYFYLVIILIYLLLLLYSASYTIKKTGPIGLLAIILLPIQHISYGLGFIKGLISR